MRSHTDFKHQTTAYLYISDFAHTDSRWSAGALDQLFAEYRFAADVTALDSSTGAIIVANAAERTEFGYDALGRRDFVGEFSSATGTTPTRTETTSYDPVSGQESLTTTSEGTVNHAYDPASGRLIRTWTTNNDTAYRYDGQGRLIDTVALVLNNVRFATYVGLDATGNPTWNDVNSTTHAHQTIQGYDAVGDLDWTLSDNGTLPTQADPTTALADDVFTDYGYDNLGRLTSESVKRGATVDQSAGTSSGGTSIFSQSFILNPDGQRTHVSETRNGSAWSTTDWAYDAQGHLKKETYADAVTSGSAGHSYVTLFTFDLSGNRQTKVQTGYDAGTWAYTYSDRDQLNTDTRTGSTVGTNDHTYLYSYDANGSQTLKAGDGADQVYTWDLRNRMWKASVGGVLTTYGYDSDGQRVSEWTAYRS